MSVALKDVYVFPAGEYENIIENTIDDFYQSRS